jgi:NIPSNAP
MAVCSVTILHVNPGRLQDFLANIAAAKAIHERVGAKVRIWQATAAGTQAGSVAYVIEHDDLAAYARFTQQLQADADWQAFQANEILGRDPAATRTSFSLFSEITP